VRYVNSKIPVIGYLIPTETIDAPNQDLSETNEIKRLKPIRTNSTTKNKSMNILETIILF